MNLTHINLSIKNIFFLTLVWLKACSKNSRSLIKIRHVFFTVYVETGTKTTPTTLSFSIAATTATRSWKVSPTLYFILSLTLDFFGFVGYKILEGI